ncbi:MAG: hypothetical protein ABIQ04_03940 [Candidatus Saccharimonadales bacterium]
MTQTIDHLPGADLPSDEYDIPVNGYIEYDIPEVSDDHDDAEPDSIGVEPVDQDAIEQYDKVLDIALDKYGSATLAKASLAQAGIHPPKGYNS